MEIERLQREVNRGGLVSSSLLAIGVTL